MGNGRDRTDKPRLTPPAMSLPERSVAALTSLFLNALATQNVGVLKEQAKRFSLAVPPDVLMRSYIATASDFCSTGKHYNLIAPVGDMLRAWMPLSLETLTTAIMMKHWSVVRAHANISVNVTDAKAKELVLATEDDNAFMAVIGIVARPSLYTLVTEMSGGMRWKVVRSLCSARVLPMSPIPWVTTDTARYNGDKHEYLSGTKLVLDTFYDDGRFCIHAVMTAAEVELCLAKQEKKKLGDMESAIMTTCAIIHGRREWFRRCPTIRCPPIATVEGLKVALAAWHVVNSQEVYRRVAKTNNQEMIKYLVQFVHTRFDLGGALAAVRSIHGHSPLLMRYLHFSAQKVDPNLIPEPLFRLDA